MTGGNVVVCNIEECWWCIVNLCLVCDKQGLVNGRFIIARVTQHQPPFITSHTTSTRHFTILSRHGYWNLELISRLRWRKFGYMPMGVPTCGARGAWMTFDTFGLLEQSMRKTMRSAVCKSSLRTLAYLVMANICTVCLYWSITVVTSLYIRLLPPYMCTQHCISLAIFTLQKLALR